MSTVFSKLVKALHDAGVYNSDVQVAPACILWPDQDRQWEAIIPRLQEEIPTLYILGEYSPETKTGPAIWLRCVLAGSIPDQKIHGNNSAQEKKPTYTTAQNIPIFYLPGISRQELRAVESCPEPLKPLAELQYQGIIWSQMNAKDWTLLAFLKSDQGGLGLDVSQDRGTLNALKLCFPQLLDEEIELLKNRHLDKDYFNTLLTGGDPYRDLLKWLDQGETFRKGRGENEWKGFVEVCKSKIGFSPENDGILTGITRLAEHEGPWLQIWERFCESPTRYAHIPNQIRKCKMPPVELFSTEETHGSWPQWNDDQENLLRSELQGLDRLPAHQARKKTKELETIHKARRGLVWAELGESPLAEALFNLSIVAQITSESLAAGTIEELVAGYSSSGWKADASVLKALKAAKKQDDIAAIITAIRSIYLPWIEDSARYLQKSVTEKEYPGKTVNTQSPILPKSGECHFFIDGLRFDVAEMLIESLSTKAYDISHRPSWSALPSVTATGKPAVSPVRTKISGELHCEDFEPVVLEGRQSLKGGYHFKKLLKDAGWQILAKNETGDVDGHAWCEFGNIDHEGHDRGWKLAGHLDSLLKDVVSRIEQLLEVGWKTIHVVTDHGWLLLPGGLPKIELASGLTVSKWGRCASIKPGASVLDALYPWYWNPDHTFVLANGVSCYKNGEDYAHGGLSLQECLTQEITISLPSSNTTILKVEVTDTAWKGLRCKIAVDGNFSTLFMDIRKQPGNEESSIVMSTKPIKEDGTASVVVENEELEGTEATIVLVDDEGDLVFQSSTQVGGDT